MLSKKVQKMAAAVIITEVVCLTGCSSGVDEQPQKLPENFSVHADIVDGGLKASADLKRSSDGWLMTMTEPENVRDMQFLLSDVGWTISCDGLSYSAGEDQLPAASPLRITARALDSCTKDKTSGKLGGQQFEVDFKNGAPAALTSDSGLKVTFSKYKKTAHS